ncbi:hypothetical protein V6N13_038344 [Hibiscus sabdariffa]
MCLFFHETFLCPTNALYTSQDSTGNHVSAASNALVQLQGENNLGLFYNIRARGKLSVGLDVALECKAIGCSATSNENVEKHQYLSETERKYNETTSTLLGLIDGLIANIKSKDTSLRDRELWYYNVTVRQLTDENGTMLHKGTLDYVLT